MVSENEKNPCLIDSPHVGEEDFTVGENVYFIEIRGGSCRCCEVVWKFFRELEFFLRKCFGEIFEMFFKKLN